MKVNGEAIYGTGPTPFGAEAGKFSDTEKDEKGQPKFVPAWDWRCTTRPGKMYVAIFRWPKDSFPLDRGQRQGGQSVSACGPRAPGAGGEAGRAARCPSRCPTTLRTPSRRSFALRTRINCSGLPPRVGCGGAPSVEARGGSVRHPATRISGCSSEQEARVPADIAVSLWQAAFRTTSLQTREAMKTLANWVPAGSCAFLSLLAVATHVGLADGPPPSSSQTPVWERLPSAELCSLV